MIAFTLGVGAGSAVAPRLMPLGRRIVTAGALVMAAGMGLILAAIRHYGSGLHPWHLVPGMIIAGLGMAMVAGTLINIVLATIPTRYSGAASSMINTTIQVGAASGVALVGTVYFGQLGDHQPVQAATGGMATVIGLYLLAALLGLVLPRDGYQPITTSMPCRRPGRQMRPGPSRGGDRDTAGRRSLTASLVTDLTAARMESCRSSSACWKSSRWPPPCSARTSATGSPPGAG
jgi:MFS family permease